MKILHLTTHLNLGGISSYLAVLAPALGKRGVQVSVLSSGGAKATELEKNGVRCHTLAIRTKSELNPKLWLSLPAATAIIKKEGVDLLHAHTRVTQIFAAVLSRLTGLPYISTAHGFYKPRLGRRILPCWGQRVIAVSELVAEELEKTHHVPRSRISVVANALDVDGLKDRLLGQDRILVRRKHHIPEEAFVIGCISRLVRDKGQEYLIEALSLLKDMPEAFVVIVGDGRERMRLEVLTRQFKLEDRVLFVAGVTDTTPLLAAIDVFAHPATWREGFGLSMAEAMLAYVPVVATKIPAIHTLFKDGEEALLVEPKDATALAAAIRRLASDQELYKRLAGAGHALAERQCRSERQAQEMKTVYQEVIAQWKIKRT